jgi:hypothetical protein
LRYSLATGAVAWAGSQVPRGLIGAAEAEELFSAADFDPPNLKFFPQSVASGDPAPEGIVLWTRALPAPKDRDGSVRVGYRIVLDDERSVRPPRHRRGSRPYLLLNVPPKVRTHVLSGWLTASSLVPPSSSPPRFSASLLLLSASSARFSASRVRL